MKLKLLVVLGLSSGLATWTGCDLAEGVANLGRCGDVAVGQTETFDDEVFIGNCKVHGTLIVKSGSKITGNINAEAGSTVIIDTASVLGNVISNDGATLTIVKGTITGNVDADGTKAVKITGTNVTGNVDFKDVTACELGTDNNIANPSGTENCTEPVAAQ